MSRAFTSAELADLKTKDNLHLVIHGKGGRALLGYCIVSGLTLPSRWPVYAVAPFVDEHPGGDEVLYGEAGRDATEAFEDVGHSDEAREILDKYIVGTCADYATKGPKTANAAAKSGSSASAR
ncbi:Structural maintenance of chromosomes protein 5 [Cystobasidiomycetes sp. EMM_F5]